MGRVCDISIAWHTSWGSENLYFLFIYIGNFIFSEIDGVKKLGNYGK